MSYFVQNTQPLEGYRCEAQSHGFRLLQVKKGDREGEREKEKERDRGREREREINREKEREREINRERERATKGA